ncbi:unnamed protein product, partial [Symbiodinium pilosum]
EVSQQLEKEKEVLRSVDGRATASEMVGHAAALASHHAKQAALDAGKLPPDLNQNQVFFEREV